VTSLHTSNALRGGRWTTRDTHIKVRSMAYVYRGSNTEVSHDYLRPCVDRFLRDAAYGSVLLDMGCGNGSFIAAYRSKGSGWKLYGTDSSTTGIQIAKETYPEVHFILADSERPSEELMALREKVDVIVSTEVIEHLYAPRDFLRSAYGMLRPGGMFIVSTPYHGYLKNLLMAVTGKLDRHFTATWDHGHIKFWSLKTLTHVLTEAGFTNFALEGAGRFPFLWKSMVIRCYKPLDPPSH
jgi:2-polyprenyl-3-methyl-5-hydroxy-6-metoxy-1,4-benzoquinol methylase